MRQGRGRQRTPPCLAMSVPAPLVAAQRRPRAGARVRVGTRRQLRALPRDGGRGDRGRARSVPVSTRPAGRARGQRADPGRGRRRGSVGLPGQRLDGAVATWVLCSVARPGAVAARLYRVLRPGGTLLVTEHVRSRNPLVGALQGAADTVWPLLSGGCHLGRDPIEVLRGSGFTLEEMTNFRFGIPPLEPAKPHVAALLRRPG